MKWEKLLMPTGIDRESSRFEGNSAELVLQPLERGFGLTLGNALRRTLLSSIQGAAITAVRIEDVRHELSIIPGVIEDVTDIILNLKQVVFEYQLDEPHWIRLSAKKEGPVTAEQLELPEGITVINPDQHICTLGEGATVSMEMYVTTGRGYVDREEVDCPDDSIGVVRLDLVAIVDTEAGQGVSIRVGNSHTRASTRQSLNVQHQPLPIEH